MNLAALQQAMAAALLDPDAPPPRGLRPAGHLAIYRHNAESSLTEALRAIYPAVDRLLGAGFFAQVALQFLRRQPPQEPRLFAYGAGFADFLAAHPPLRPFGYLPDVARLEWAWNQAFHAAGAPLLDAAALAKLAPGSLPGLRLRLLPSVRLIASNYPVDLIHAANLPGVPERTIDLDGGGVRLLVWRSAVTVLVRRIGDAAFAIARGAGDGATLGGILDELDPDRFGPALGELIELGAFRAL